MKQEDYDGLPPPDFDLDEMVYEEGRKRAFLTDVSLACSEMDGVLMGHEVALNAYHALRFLDKANSRYKLTAHDYAALRLRALLIREPLLDLFPRLADRRQAALGHDALLKWIDRLAQSPDEREPWHHSPAPRAIYRQLRVLRNLCHNAYLLESIEKAERQELWWPGS